MATHLYHPRAPFPDHHKITASGSYAAIHVYNMLSFLSVQCLSRLKFNGNRFLEPFWESFYLYFILRDPYKERYILSSSQVLRCRLLGDLFLAAPFLVTPSSGCFTFSDGSADFM